MILQGKYAVQCNNSIQYKMIKALYEGIGGKVIIFDLCIIVWLNIILPKSPNEVIENGN